MTHQTENGFTRIANSLLEAMLASNLSKREWQVMMFLFRRTYGFNEKHCRATSTFIAEGTGIHAPHVRATLRDLEEAGCIEREGQMVLILKAGFPIVRGSKPSKRTETVRTETVRTETVREAYQNSPANGLKQSTSKDTFKDKPKDIPPISPPFAEFWDQYPRKVAKAKAATCWKNLTKTDRTAALAALPGWPFPPESRFQPYATTWLNQRRWEDEPDTAPTTTRSNGNGNYRQQQHEFLERQAALAGLGLGATATDDGLVVDMDGGLVRRRLLGQDGA